MRLITASAIARVRACPASQAFPWATSSSEYANRGNEIHRYLANAVTYGREKALADVPPEHRTDCAGIDLLEATAALEGATPFCEVSFAYDVVSGKARKLGEGLNRKYPTLAPTEIAGTADLVGYGEGRVIVPDYKTGHHSLSPVENNAQLRTLALMAARSFGAEEAKVAIIYVRPDGIVTESATLDAMDLDAWAHELRVMVGKVANAEAVISEGRTPDVHMTDDGCRYCPALRYCPAHRGLFGELLDGKPWTLDSASVAWERLRNAKREFAAAEDTLKQIIRQSPITTSDGKTVREVEVPTREVNPDVAYNVITSICGAEAAAKAMEPKYSQASIKRATGVDAKRVLGELEKQGGFTTSVKRMIKEVA